LSKSKLPFTSGFVRRAVTSSSNQIAHGWTSLFDPTTELTDVTVHDPEIVIPLRLHITTDGMIENGYDPITSDALIVRLVFTVHGEMKRNETDSNGQPLPWAPALSISVSDVDLGELATQMSEDSRQKLKAMVLGKKIQIPVTLQPVKKLLR